MRDVQLTTEWGHNSQSRSCGASDHTAHEFRKGDYEYLFEIVECYGKSLFNEMG